MEKALVNTSGFGTTAVAATAGTVLASTNNVTMTIAFDDSYKTVPIDGLTINNALLNIFRINEENFNVATDMGLQGSANPKDAGGGTPSSTLAPPVSGCVYEFDVKKDGYLYIFAKLSSSQPYTIFEQGAARDYSYAQGTTTLDNTLSYTLKGSSEGSGGSEDYLTDAVLTPQEYDARYGTAYNTASMGVVKVKVYADYKYLFNANGSQATVLGYAWNDADVDTIEITDGESNSITLMKAVLTPETPIGVPELAPLKNGNCVTRSIYVFDDYNTDIQTNVDHVNTRVDYVNTRVDSVETRINKLPIKAGTGIQSTQEGYNTTASGNYSHAEGYNTTASGNYSHTEGYNTGTYNDMAHSEGGRTSATGQFSHAEGNATTAIGSRSHSEGLWTNAAKDCSHAEGLYTVSNSLGGHAEGNGNIGNEDSISEIGIGNFTTGGTTGNRKNAREWKTNGNYYVYGVGGYDGTNYRASQTLQTVINNLKRLQYPLIVHSDVGIKVQDIITNEQTDVTLSNQVYSNTGKKIIGIGDSTDIAIVEGVIDDNNMTMFKGNNNINSIVLYPNVRTENLTSTTYMFSDNHNLFVIDLGNLVTQNVTNMSYMFNNCSNCSTLKYNTHTFDTSNVTNMSYMFTGVMVTTLNTDFNTSKVTNMSNMFASSTALETLDISSFDFSKATAVNAMFNGCTALKNITFGSNLSINISFADCPLTEASAVAIFNKLADLTGKTASTISLSTATKALLTDADKAIATSKNWTIA